MQNNPSRTKPAPVQRKLCTISNVCEQISVGRSTVYQLIGDGSLRRVKVGARTLIPQADVDAFVAGLLDGDVQTDPRRVASAGA